MTINPVNQEHRERLLQQGLICFVVGIVCFIAGATLVTARYDLPDFTRSIGQIIFAAWPILTLVAAYLRFRGGGLKDWLVWTSLAVIIIPSVMVTFIAV